MTHPLHQRGLMAALCMAMPLCLAAETYPTAPNYDNPEADTARQSLLLDETIVTTRRTTTIRRNLPSSITILSGKTLEQQQHFGIKDLNASVPNLYLPDYGSSLSTPLYIRGIGSRRSDRSAAVGLYYAGVPLMEQASFDADHSELQAIEVLRGPQGALYGRGGMGGIINMVPRSPLTHEGTFLSLYGGSYSQRGISAARYRKVGERTGMSGNVAYHYRRGFFTNSYTGREVDGSHAISGQLAIEHRSTRGWHLHAFAQYQYKDQGGYAYGTIDSLRQSHIRYNTPSGYQRSLLTTGLSVRKTWASGLDLRLATSYQDLKDRMTLDQDFTAAPIFEAVQRTRKRIVTQEVSLSGHAGQSYKWLVGASGYYNNGSRHMNMTMSAPTRMYMYYGYNEPQWGGALFHHSSLRLLPQLTLEADARIDWERNTQDYTTTTTAGPRTQTSGSDLGQTYLQVSPKASLIYSPTNLGRIYATVSRGYNAGGFNNSFEQESERYYRPEHSWNYELGTRWSTADNRFVADASLFFIDWHQQQVQRILPSNMGSLYTNAGRSRSLGAEASLAYQPIDALTFTAAYGFTRATFRTYTNGTTDYAGRYIPFVPRHTLSLTAEYVARLRHQHIEQVRFATQLRALGKTYWNDANTLHEPFYTTLNAQVSIEGKHAILEVWGKNLLNRRYYAYQFLYRGNTLGQMGAPAHWGATLRLRLK